MRKLQTVHRVAIVLAGVESPAHVIITDSGTVFLSAQLLSEITVHIGIKKTPVTVSANDEVIITLDLIVR